MSTEHPVLSVQALTTVYCVLVCYIFASVLDGRIGAAEDDWPASLHGMSKVGIFGTRPMD
jgi:hypothetical protein